MRQICGRVTAIDEPVGALALDDDGLARAEIEHGQPALRRGADEVETKKWPPGSDAKK